MSPRATPSDAGLREDIRFLGRLLGDTIREQAGDDVFALVEHIRRTRDRVPAPARRREPEGPREADRRARPDAGDAHRARVQLLPSPGQHRRGPAPDARGAAPGHRAGACRRRARGRSDDGRARAAETDAPEGSIAFALRRLRAAGVPSRQIVAMLERAKVEPVLTAHPTEVQRKSVLDRQRAITDELVANDRTGWPGGKAPAALERELRRQVLLLWKTSELRLVKPTVADEIENGLAYFKSTFLEVLPRLYADLEDELGDGVRLAPFLRVASWIGGDRDGNPYVTHDVTRRAVERQASLVMAHYLGEVNALGSELGALVGVHQDLARARRAGGALARSRGQPRARAVPARADRRLRAARGDAARAGGRQPGIGGAARARGRPGAALRRARGAAGRPRSHRDGAGQRRRRPGRRGPPALPAARGEHVRVSPGADRSAAAQRRARARRARDRGALDGPRRLRDDVRAGAAGHAAARAGDGAAAGLAAHPLLRGDDRGAADARGGRRDPSPLRRASPSRTTSSR